MSKHHQPIVSAWVAVVLAYASETLCSADAALPRSHWHFHSSGFDVATVCCFMNDSKETTDSGWLSELRSTFMSKYEMTFFHTTIKSRHKYTFDNCKRLILGGQIFCNFYWLFNNAFTHTYILSYISAHQEPVTFMLTFQSAVMKCRDESNEFYLLKIE